MIIEDIMKTEVYKLAPDAPVKDAITLFTEKKIRHVPIVTEDNKVVGILSERDLKEFLPSRFAGAPAQELYDRPLSSIMVKDPVTAHPLDFVEEAALIMYTKRIGCLPVVNKGDLVGFLTETDLLYTYIRLAGVDQPGSQIEIRVPDRSGILYEITKIFYDQDVNVLSALVYPDRTNEAEKVLVFRVQTMNPFSLAQDLRSEGFDVLWPRNSETKG